MTAEIQTGMCESEMLVRVYARPRLLNLMQSLEDNHKLIVAWHLQSTPNRRL